MIRNLLPAVFFFTAAAFAQSPTPAQIEQAQEAVRSGAVEVTPDLIDQAREQFPDLQDVPDTEILERAREVQDDGEPAGEATDENGREEAVEEELADYTEEDEGFREEDDPAFDEDGEEISPSSRSRVSGPGNTPDTRFPSGLRRFGHDFFRNIDGAGLGPNIPSLPDYVLSPGDELRVNTWGRESRQQAITINREGMFHLPPLQPMRLSGMRFEDAQRQVVEEVEKIHGVSAAVTLGQLRSIRIMVLGEASRPGSYTMPAGVTVTSALFRSGGITGIGSLRNIEVRRDDTVAARLDVYDMLLRGDNRGDIQLLPGDVIFVPVARIQVAVQGNVKRPAIYEVKPGFRALEAIELAGGLSSTAHRGRLRLDRIEQNTRKVVLDVDMGTAGTRANVALEDGDVLFVDQVLPRIEQAVFLSGNVNRPGRYQFRPGMTVRDLVPSLEALKPESYFEYGHIRRPAPDDDRPTILSFSLREVIDGTTRVALEPRDEVIIYNRYQVIERPSVRISGVVRRGGEFLYREGMTVTDLVILAGGVRDIYLPEAQLRRTAYDAERDSTFTELVRVNLKAALENPKGDSNLVLRPFDALTIFPRNVFEPAGTVSVRGTIRNPGRFPLSQGMRVSDLIVLGRGLPDDAHVLEAHLNRRMYDAERDTFFVELARVNLRRILESPGGEHDVELRPHDELRVFHRNVFEPRRHVSIGGAVRSPGRYPMIEQMRVTDLIALGGGLADAHMLEAHLFREVPVPERDSSFKQLVRINLREAIADTVGWENLVLRPFDSLRVLPRGYFVHPRSVAIHGAVRNGGDFRLAEDMEIPDLIKMAGGLTKSSYKLEIEVVRRHIVDDSIMTREVKRLRLMDVLDGKTTFALQDRDGVYIREIIQYRERSTVTLSGEFNFPGVYEFVPGETISSVIRRAGGFTPEAYVRGTVFLRQSVREQQLRHAREVSRRIESQLEASLLQTTAESDRLLINTAIERNRFLVREIAEAPHLGRVIVKVDRDLKFEGSDWDVPLEAGDRIQVGPTVSTVSILGEVYAPTTVIHTRSTNTVGKALSRAGGVNTFGDYKSTYYIDPDGTISTPRTTAWFMSFRSKRVHPGGSVIVPLKPPAKDYLQAWVQGTQILYQLAISVGVAKTLF